MILGSFIVFFICSYIFSIFSWYVTCFIFLNVILGSFIVFYLFIYFFNIFMVCYMFHIFKCDFRKFHCFLFVHIFFQYFHGMFHIF